VSKQHPDGESKILFIYNKELVLLLAIIWMDLENIMLVREASQKQPHITWLHLCEMSRISKSIETKSSFMVDRGERREEPGLTATRYRFLF
jgi:hypothetical protein